MFRMLRLDPPHGWRAVWWELAIVTAGVLLALVAQQLAEAANWRSRVADGKARLAAELNIHFAQLYEQASVSTCIDRQLDQLAKSVLAGQPIPTFNDDLFGPIVWRAPHRDYSEGVWQGLISEGVASHFDRDYAARLANYYTQLASMRLSVERTNAADADFAYLSRGVLPTGDARLALVARVDGLRRVTQAMAVDSNQLLRTLDKIGIHPSDAERHALLPRSRTTNFCRARGLPVIAPQFSISMS